MPGLGLKCPISSSMSRTADFLSKGKVVNIFGFVGHIACHKYSVPPLQHESSYRQCIHECVWLCPKKTSFIKMGSLEIYRREIKAWIYKDT